MIRRFKSDEPVDLAACLAACARGLRSTRTLLMQGETPDDLTHALLDAVALFDGLDIRYALVGGLAAMVHGRARFTQDVDFIAQPGHETVLAAHGDVMQAHGFDASCTWKLYHRSGLGVDLWKDEHVPGMLDRAEPRTLADREVFVVSAVDLLAMKLRASRPQDDYDVSQIIAHVDADVDERALRGLVDDMQFEHFLDLKRRTPRNPGGEAQP